MAKTDNPQLIVSLTSYPARIKTVHITIQSILNQSLRADKIILWLSPEEFPQKEAELPKELLELKTNGLEIDWYTNIKSYKKLIPTLKKYPNDIIVTIDDDLVFKKDMLKRLYKEYLKDKHFIYCHRITRLYQQNNKFQILNRKNYLDRLNRFYHTIVQKPSAYNKLSGGGGALYPPNCFPKDVLEETKFLSLAPSSDDIWFWLQALRNGYKVKVVKNNLWKLNYIPDTQAVGLCKINDINDNKVFFEHLNNIIKEYPDLKEIFALDDDKNNKVIRTLLSLHRLTDLFNIRNEYIEFKKYKVISILGFKLKFKR